MTARNLADPSYEPSDEDLRELLARAAVDARAGHIRAETMLLERIRAERVRLGVLPAETAPKVT
ncbi:MAG: hypothetical protein ACK6CU_02925 [Deltaproteobacteria bacterium]